MASYGDSRLVTASRQRDIVARSVNLSVLCSTVVLYTSSKRYTLTGGGWRSDRICDVNFSPLLRHSTAKVYRSPQPGRRVGPTVRKRFPRGLRSSDEYFIMSDRGPLTSVRATGFITLD